LNSDLIGGDRFFRPLGGQTALKSARFLTTIFFFARVSKNFFDSLTSTYRFQYKISIKRAEK